MGTPQAGILPEPPENAIFVILSVTQGAPLIQVAQAGLGVPLDADAIAQKDSDARVSATVAYSSPLWDQLSPGKRPKHLWPFRAIASNGRSAPDTGGDVLLHILASRRDLAGELLVSVMNRFRPYTKVEMEVNGFGYRKTKDFRDDRTHSRDFTGFIDGTENPHEPADRTGAALITAADDPDFEGGSYVFTQRYVHDLTGWRNVPEQIQESIIGRRKSDSTELVGSAKLDGAHISRTVIEENGAELKIVRHSFPYATASEAGLFFIAYTRDLTIPERMLARMMGTSGDGIHDSLMAWSRAVSGANFFAPSLEVLKSVA